MEETGDRPDCDEFIAFGNGKAAKTGYSGTDPMYIEHDSIL
jgi:hypothetical protein